MGTPSVERRETITEILNTNGVHHSERMIGGANLQASTDIFFKPSSSSGDDDNEESFCLLISEPIASATDSVK